MSTKRQSKLSVIMTAALIAGGCASTSPGTLVTRQDAHTPPTMTKAQQDGAYGLFIAGESDPVFAVQLRQGDEIGFEQANRATVGSLQIIYLYAVYGGNRYPVNAAKTYEWRWLYAARK